MRFQRGKAFKVFNTWHPACCCCLVTKSCPTLCDPMNCSHPHAPLSMGFPGQEYWMGCHFFLHGFFPTQGSNSHLLHWQADSLPLSHLGSLQNTSHSINEVAGPSPHPPNHRIQKDSKNKRMFTISPGLETFVVLFTLFGVNISKCCCRTQCGPLTAHCTRILLLNDIYHSPFQKSV